MEGLVPLGRPNPLQGFFDDVDRSYVVAQLEGRLDQPVTLEVTRSNVSPLLLAGPAGGPDPAEGARAQQLANELAQLVPEVTVRVTDAAPGELSPVITVHGPAGGRVRFLGVPRVNIFRMLLEAVRRTSTSEYDLPADRVRTLAGLSDDVRMLVFATPTCPACPPVLSLAIRLALAAPRVSVESVDGLAFTDLVLDWGVSGVPTVVLNERLLVQGPVPEEVLVEFVLHAADRRHPAPLISSVPFRSCGRLEVAEH